MEYKAEIPKKGNLLKAEIVSFLNSEGGTILLGADDQGRVLEEKIKDYKRWEEILSNWIFNAFYPEVIDLIQVFPNEIPFRILIKKGKEKPYFYKEGEGFHAKGVYIRVGSSKRVASFQEIQRMIFATKSHEYESLPCEKTNLTFQYLENKLEEKGITFDSYGLSLLDKEGKYNNAALLLSDQNPTISKFAVFQGLDVSIFLDKKEFRGSILKQLDDILYFSNLSNKKKIIYTHNRSRMNKKQKDKGLMKAVKEQPQFRLTSNFTFRTMQKVEEAILLREKKQERKMLLATIAASLFLIISGSIGLYIYFGNHIKETMYHAFLAGSHVLKIQIPLIYLLFIITIPLFMVFDRWMRKQYFKRHS